LRQNRDETEFRVQMSIGGTVSQGDRATWSCLTFRTPLRCFFFLN
jgi:hypothetical protein